MERFYGLYSPVIRGAIKVKKLQTPNPPTDPIDPFESKTTAGKASWAKCIKLVYEINPMECPICNGQMKIVAFILDQREIPKILKAAGLPSYRAPPQFDPDFQPTPDIHWT